MLQPRVVLSKVCQGRIDGPAWAGDFVALIWETAPPHLRRRRRSLPNRRPAWAAC